MRTVIGMWICVILAFVSFFAGIMHDHEFIGCIAGLFFVFWGFKIFDNSPKEFRDAVHELQKQEENEKEYKKMHGGYKCPSCGWMAGHRIGGISKSISIDMLGMASDELGKTYRCEKCRYMW